MKTLAEYQDLVHAAEALAAVRPQAYRLRVAGLAALGIGYVLLMLAGTLALVAAAVAAIVVSKSVALVKLAWVPLAFAFVIARSLWVRLPPPAGEPVRPEEAPALFAEIELVRQRMNARRIHSVVLTPDFNAAVSQVPRLGILGWPKNHLILGLPLLAALTPEQFRAVLAHEFGHLARNHARFGNWIYRIRQVWGQLLGALEAKGGRTTRLFTRFFDWYGPYFNAYSFVLARANEYEADDASARVAGASNAAAALTAVYAKAEYAERRYWGDFYAAATTRPEPPEQPFARYLAALRTVPADAAREGVAAALARRTTLENTHPSLADRLRALGEPAPALTSVERSAAEALLGPLLARLVDSTEAQWREGIGEAWRDHHRRMTETHERMAELATSTPQTLDDDALFELAVLSERTGDAGAARNLLETLLARRPDHAAARFMRGRMRLAADDDGGVEDVEHSMRVDEAALEAGSELLYRHWYARNDIARCQPHLDTLSRLASQREAARQERAQARPADTYEPHGLEDGALAVYRSSVESNRKVRRAWLVRKQVQHFPESPCFVLVVEFGFWSRPSQAMLQAMVDALPDEHAHLLLNRTYHRKTWRRIRKVPGALIHPTA